jgi:hypothetical protein
LCLGLKSSQMQDFMRMYSNLVERCFSSCANDFTSKALSAKEVYVGFSVFQNLTLIT